MSTKNVESSPGRVFKKLPAVASMRRRHVISDAEMYSLLPDGTRRPVGIYRLGIRGTQNVNDGLGNTHQKRNGDEGDRGVQQPQTLDTAKLDSDAVGLVVRFGLSMLDLRDGVEMCLDSQDQATASEFRASIGDFVTRARDTDAVLMLASRYARNIANGRWLWRNRTMARSIETTVHSKSGKCIAVFDALSIPLTHFDNITRPEEQLALELSKQMRGESLEGVVVEATLTLCVDGAVEVHPSQNYVEKDRRKVQQDDVSRSLYRIRSARQTDGYESSLVGFAGIRDAKIANAIRTIDTWYDDYDETGSPIPIEPLGASIAHQEFFRRGDRCAFEMFKRLEHIGPVSQDGLYCLACIERGGVYGPARMISPKKEDALRPMSKESSTAGALVSRDAEAVAALSTDVSDASAPKRQKTGSAKKQPTKNTPTKAGKNTSAS